GALSLKVRKTDPADPVRNIRLLPPGPESAESPFRPAFLGRCAPFKVLRFMDWQRTNNSPLVEWKDRCTPEYFSHGTDKGVAAEYMLALPNALDPPPWFSTPHKAPDDFVRHFARLAKARLKPSLRVYVEYSNEVWNGIFAQAGYARERGKALGL